MDRLKKQQRFRRTNNIFGKHGRLGCVFSFGNSREECLVDIRIENELWTRNSVNSIHYLICYMIDIRSIIEEKCWLLYDGYR